MNIDDCAELLDDAAREARAVAQLSATLPELGLAEAFEIQRRSIARRQARGERIVGLKMGFTSRAKMLQMGVSDLIWGRLTDAMRVEAGGELSLSRFIHPRAEPEIAFRLARPLSGSVSVEAAKRAVDGVAPAIEIIDSRYRDFRFALNDVVADNSSSSAFVVGDWHDPDCIDLAGLPMRLDFDGATVQSGTSDAILGNPWQSLVEAARLAEAADMVLESGWIVLAGAATAAEALRPGIAVSADAGALGSVGFRVRGTRTEGEKQS